MKLKVLFGLLTVIATAIAPLPAQSYDVAAVTGGGTIEGVVVFNGAVPSKKIIPTKDVDLCGGPYEEKLVEVGPDKGVQNAVVYLAQVAKGKAWPAQPKPPEVDNVKCKFAPHVQVIRPGKLDVVNSDPVLHNTHGYYGKRTAFNSPCRTRTSAFRSICRAPARFASTATRTAGWKGGSTSSTIPTTRSPAPTANSPSPTCRPAPTRWWRCNPSPDRPRRSP